MLSSGTTAQKTNKPISDAIEELYLSICREVAEIACVVETGIGNKQTNTRVFYKSFKALLTLTRNDPGLVKRSNGLIEDVDEWFSQKKSLYHLDQGMALSERYNKLLFDSGILSLGASIRNK